MQLRDKASAEQLWCKRTFSCFSLFTTKYKEFLHAAVIYRERQHLYLVVSWAGCCVLGWGLTSCGGGGGLGVMDGAWVVLERLSWETNRTRAGWTTEKRSHSHLLLYFVPWPSSDLTDRSSSYRTRPVVAPAGPQPGRGTGPDDPSADAAPRTSASSHLPAASSKPPGDRQRHAGEIFKSKIFHQHVGSEKTNYLVYFETFKHFEHDLHIQNTI